MGLLIRRQKIVAAGRNAKMPRRLPLRRLALNRRQPPRCRIHAKNRNAVVPPIRDINKLAVGMRPDFCRGIAGGGVFE